MDISIKLSLIAILLALVSLVAGLASGFPGRRIAWIGIPCALFAIGLSALNIIQRLM